jgi:hypothetical protein
MLFDVKQFEQFFKELSLRKGLKLFERGELELVERHSDFEYRFFIKGRELLLKKKGDKLIHYLCSCSKDHYCEHLSASMFYFQQEALGIRIKRKRSVPKTSGDSKITYHKNNSKDLKKIENQSLSRFIKEHHNQLYAKDIYSFLTSRSGISLFDIYCLQMEILLEPYLALKKLDQKNIDAINGEISVFIKKSKTQNKKDDLFYVYLAIVRGFIPLFNTRFTGNEVLVFELYHKIIKLLDTSYSEGLSVLQRKAWFNVTLRSIESDKNLYSEAFTFFIPRALSITKNREKLEELHVLLSKRKYKIPYYHSLDKLLIARLQVAQREWILFKMPFSFNIKSGGEVELLIAKAELLFCSNRVDKAFIFLESNYEPVRTGNPNYYNDYLDYILLNAENRKKQQIELKYLKESFINRIFILPKNLNRFLKLLPKKKQAPEVKALIQKLKSNSSMHSKEKIPMLLAALSHLEIPAKEKDKKVPGHKFNVVHETALRKLPVYDEDVLSLYINELLQAFSGNIYFQQVKLFDTAKEYLDRLPEKIVHEVIKKVLTGIGKTGQIYRYINEMYGFPFLKDEGVYVNPPA